MAAPIIYRDQDASAPALDGTAGTLVELLDACLVNGYGSKDPAGWAIAFTGTDKRAYRAPTGARHYFRIQDDAPGAGTGKEARIVGYESMSAIDTGTALFPTAAQKANGLFIRKSGNTSADPRKWVVIADERTVYMFVNSGETIDEAWFAFGFGEFYSFITGDAYNSFLIARDTENSLSAANEALGRLSVPFGSSVIGHYLPRIAAQTGTSHQFGKFGGTPLGGSAELTGTLYWPPTSGQPNSFGSYVTLYDVSGTDSVLRGRLRGFYHWLHYHSTSISSRQRICEFALVHGKAGSIWENKEFMHLWFPQTTNGTTCSYLMETTEWETN